MADHKENQDARNTAVRRRSPRMVAVCGMLFAVAILTMLVLFARLPQRKTVYSKVDPQSGYQCSISVPSNWVVDDSDYRNNASPELVESIRVSRPRENPIVSWLRLHVLRVTPTDRGASNVPRSLQTVNVHIQRVERDQLSALDLTETEVGSSPALTSLESQNIHLSGLPATWTVGTWNDMARRKPTIMAVQYKLSVVQPNTGLDYEISGACNSDNVGCKQEITAIRDSFRVEKVGAK